MELELGQGWADVVSKILRMGTHNPETNRILSKAKKDQYNDDSSDEEVPKKDFGLYSTKRLKPNPQSDALVENELKNIATRGVVHLFNAVKTVNPKADKKRKKKKTKKRKKRKMKKFKKRSGKH